MPMAVKLVESIGAPRIIPKPILLRAMIPRTMVQYLHSHIALVGTPMRA